MKIPEYMGKYGLTIQKLTMEDIGEIGNQDVVTYEITGENELWCCDSLEELEDFLKMQKEHPRKYLECIQEDSDCTCCPMCKYGVDCRLYPINETRAMRDARMIARRRKDGTVQFGLLGTLKECRNVGPILGCWYDAPDKVDYLFSQGQLFNVGELYSETFERFPETHKNCPTGVPYWESKTETDIFFNYMAAGYCRYLYKSDAECDDFYENKAPQYGYLYDTDCQWYYIMSGLFTLKIPFSLELANMNKEEPEFWFIEEVQGMVLKYIVDEYSKTDPEFASILADCNQDVLRMVLDGTAPTILLCFKYPQILEYFDNWVVVLPDAEGKNVGSILVRKREEPRKETIDWPGYPIHEAKPYLNLAMFDYALAHVGTWLESVLEAREYNKARKNNEEPVKEIPPCDVPEWFLLEFASTVGYKEVGVQLIRQHFSDLNHVSESFDKKLEEGLILGKDYYEKSVEKTKAGRGRRQDVRILSA